MLRKPEAERGNRSGGRGGLPCLGRRSAHPGLFDDVHYPGRAGIQLAGLAFIIAGQLKERAGVGAAVRAAAAPIRTGVVSCRSRVLGPMTFRGEPIRSLPQHETERLLEARLHELAPDAL